MTIDMALSAPDLTQGLPSGEELCPLGWSAPPPPPSPLLHARSGAPGEQPAAALRGAPLPPSTLSAPHSRVVVLPDVHGDLQQAQQALQLAGVVDGDGRWVGGRALVVQLGDVLDRGPHSLLALDYFQQLKVVLLGPLEAG